MNPLGVCSWSLCPQSCDDLARRVRQCGLTRIQLALDPIGEAGWELDRVKDIVEAGDISLVSGMMTTVGEDYTTLESIKRTGGIRPDEHWETNHSRAMKNAQIASELGLQLVTVHAGFLPDTDSSQRHTMIDRIDELAQVFGNRGIQLALETGQERAETLIELLELPRLSGIGINFDPANMILYGMGDPTQSIETLRDRIVQVHMKDAVPAQTQGQWGREVPAGKGDVDWASFFSALRSLEAKINVMIEREGTDHRLDDILDITGARSLAQNHGCIA